MIEEHTYGAVSYLLSCKGFYDSVFTRVIAVVLILLLSIKLDQTRCFTHGRIRDKYLKKIDRKAWKELGAKNLLYPRKKLRNYFTSVQIDSFTNRNCRTMVNKESELSVAYSKAQDEATAQEIFRPA